MDGREVKVFEELVELTASILKEASSQQADLALLTTATKPYLIPLIQTEVQFYAALIHLAKLKPADEASLIGFGNTFQHSGSVVVITGNPTDLSYNQSCLVLKM